MYSLGTSTGYAADGDCRPIRVRPGLYYHRQGLFLGVAGFCLSVEPEPPVGPSGLGGAAGRDCLGLGLWGLVAATCRARLQWPSSETFQKHRERANPESVEAIS